MHAGVSIQNGTNCHSYYTYVLIYQFFIKIHMANSLRFLAHNCKIRLEKNENIAKHIGHLFVNILG